MEAAAAAAKRHRLGLWDWLCCAVSTERDGTADVRRDRGTLEGRIRHVCPCLFPLQCFWTTAAPAPVPRFGSPIRRNVAQHELRSAAESGGIMRYRTQLARRSALKSSRTLILFLYLFYGLHTRLPRPQTGHLLYGCKHKQTL